MNDEVPLERKPMDCWWEPIAHTAEDRTRHLHRESLDGEAGELMVPSYKYRKELIAYNESIYVAERVKIWTFPSESFSRFPRVSIGFPLEIQPCSPLFMVQRPTLHNSPLIWEDF